MRSARSSDVRTRHCSTGRKRKSRGLSAIELLTTLTIAAILLGMAVPSYTNLISTYRVKAVSSEIYLSLVRARSEAARFNQSITITPKSSSWQSGWTLTDSSANTLYSQDASSYVSVSGGPTNIIYMSSGRIQGTVAPSFSIAATNGRGEKRCVSVDLSGRPYVKAALC